MAVTTTPDRITPTRPVLMLALAALVALTALGLSPARPAAALTPGAPRVLGPIGWDGEALVAWSVPETGGKKITQYVLQRFLGDAPQPQKTVLLPGSQASYVDTGLTNATTYRYRVQAHNADGASPWSGKEAVQPKAFRTHLAPFADAETYVKRQYQDLLGRAPSPAELAFGKIAVTQGLSGDFTEELAHTPARVSQRHPVIRLYFAFFRRSPDLAGTDYWIGRRQTGTNLNQIADHFAASPEFKSLYGNLSNQAFVTQVYVNVLDRQPDPAGLAYWTQQLDQKKRTRGQVMVGFSESQEYAGGNGTMGRSTGRVEAADIWLALMKTVPSADALDTYYASHIQNGGSQGELAMLLMPTLGYPK